MLAIAVSLVALSLDVESCGALVDVTALSSPDIEMDAQIVCVGGRMFITREGQTFPDAEVVGLAARPPSERAELVVSTLRAVAMGSRTKLDAEAVRALLLTPRAATVPLRVLGRASMPIGYAQSLDAADDIFLCLTPCTLHVTPGIARFVRGGQGSDFRRHPEEVAVPPQGLDVEYRAPLRSRWLAGAALTGIGAAMDAIGFWIFIAGIVTYSGGFEVGFAGLSVWMAGLGAVLPTGIALMGSERLGKARTAPVGRLQYVNLSVSLSGFTLSFP